MADCLSPQIFQSSAVASESCFASSSPGRERSHCSAEKEQEEKKIKKREWQASRTESIMLVKTWLDSEISAQIWSQSEKGKQLV